jgi:hypothetical protein
VPERCQPSIDVGQVSTSISFTTQTQTGAWLSPGRPPAPAMLLLALMVALTLVHAGFPPPAPPTHQLSAEDLWSFRERVRKMWYHAWEGYMEHAWPHDELRPLTCKPRRWDQRERGTLDDPLGGFSLTAIDSLQALAIIGDAKSFHRIGSELCASIVFDRDVDVSFFETTIRVLGGLLAAHALADESEAAHIARSAQEQGKPVPPLARHALVSLPRLWPDYDGCLLRLASQVGHRLAHAYTDTQTNAEALKHSVEQDMQAWGNSSSSGLAPPFSLPSTPLLKLPRHLVNLKGGITHRLQQETQTCAAAAGTSLLEASLLSAFTRNQTHAVLAARATANILSLRPSPTGLVGGGVDVSSGAWTSPHTGIGAGTDSFYEYLLKSALLLDSPGLFEAWEEALDAIARHLTLELPHPPAPEPGPLHLPAKEYFQHYASLLSAMAKNTTPPESALSPPSAWMAGSTLFLEVPVSVGRSQHKPVVVTSLQAFWPAALVLAGRVAEARAVFRPLLGVWKLSGAIPEVWDVTSGQPISFAKDAPLRPELIESLYSLYTATGDDFYVRQAVSMMEAIQTRSRTACGYASIADVSSNRLDDRMDSYFLSETLVYLFLTFDHALRLQAKTNPAAVALAHKAGSKSDFGSLFSAPWGYDPFASSPVQEHGRWNDLEQFGLFTTEGHLLLLTPRLRRSIREMQTAVARDAGVSLNLSLLLPNQQAPPPQGASLASVARSIASAVSSAVSPGTAALDTFEFQQARELLLPGAWEESIDQAVALQRGGAATRAKPEALPPPQEPQHLDFDSYCPIWAQAHRLPPLHLTATNRSDTHDLLDALEAHSIADALWAAAPSESIRVLLKHSSDAHAAAVREGQPLHLAAPMAFSPDHHAASSSHRVTPVQHVAPATPPPVSRPSLLMGLRQPDGVFRVAHQSLVDGQLRPAPAHSAPVPPEDFEIALNHADLPGVESAVIECAPVHSSDPTKHGCSVMAPLARGYLARVQLQPAPSLLSQWGIPASAAAFGPILSPVGVEARPAILHPIHACTPAPGRDAPLLLQCTHNPYQPTVALALRGGCTFEQKARLAKRAGASALIVLDVSPPQSPTSTPASNAGQRPWVTFWNVLADQATQFLMAADGEGKPPVHDLPALLLRDAATDELLKSLRVRGKPCPSIPCTSASLAALAEPWTSSQNPDPALLNAVPELTCRATNDHLSLTLFRDPSHGRKASRLTPPPSPEELSTEDLASGFSLPLSNLTWDGTSRFSHHPAQAVAAIFQQLLVAHGKLDVH